MGPLSDIKVLDFTRVLAGPYATMILGDLGAEIIKIEQPGSGDDSRAFGPYKNGESGYFMSLNRNKMSLTLNLKKPEGKAIVEKLVTEADVVVENFRPGTMDRLGLGYGHLKTINPRLIYAASTGYGQTGPYSQKPAYDGVVQALGGIMSITGSEGGQATRVGPSIGDIAAGMFTVIGILTALHERENSGKGQMVDVAMLDCQVALLENAIARYEITGQVPGPIGNRHPSIAPFEPFDTSTAQIMIAIGNDKLWQTFTSLVGLEFEAPEKFVTNPDRIRNYKELRPYIEAKMKEKTCEEWQVILDEAGIPNGPINTIDKVVSDQQILYRNMIQEVDHPVAGKTKIPGIPVKLSETPGSVRSAAPVLGADTEYILQKYLGMDEGQIAALRKNNVI